MQDSLPPLNLKSELIASHHSAYFTLISIIQGAAMAYLVTVADRDSKAFDAHHWILLGCTFLLIVAIWNSYVRGITPVLYPPRFLDSLIPFLFGVVECCLIASIPMDSRAWWLWFSGLAFVGCVAYSNMWRSARRCTLNAANWPYLGRQTLVHLCVCLAMTLTTLIFYFVPCPAVVNSIFAIIFSVGYIIFDEVLWTRLLRHAKAI